jgi:hypothetical protein
LSLSTAATMLFYALVMSVMLTREIGAFINRDLLIYLFKLLFPSLAMLGVVWGFAFMGWGTSGVSFLLPLTASIVVYLGIAYILGLIKVFFLKEV